MRRREFIAGTAATAAMGFAQPIWAETNARSTGVKRLAIFYPGEIGPDNRSRNFVSLQFIRFREFVEVGGLMAYGVDLADVMRRLAGVTGQVLGGAKPSDIPFYRQTKYELVLNQKTATSLGLEFPTTLLTTADEVID